MALLGWKVRILNLVLLIHLHMHLKGPFPYAMVSVSMHSCWGFGEHGTASQIIVRCTEPACHSSFTPGLNRWKCSVQDYTKPIICTEKRLLYTSNCFCVFLNQGSVDLNLRELMLASVNVMTNQDCFSQVVITWKFEKSLRGRLIISCLKGSRLITMVWPSID